MSTSSESDKPSPLPSTVSETKPAAGQRYQILRPHDKGGIGEVFVALDQELIRQVALKEIQERHAADAHSRGRFVREAEITGGLEHPGIVPVYGLGQYADGRPFYAMRFIQGETLKDAIARHHQLLDGERIDCAAGIGCLVLTHQLGEHAAELLEIGWLQRFDACKLLAGLVFLAGADKTADPEHTRFGAGRIQTHPGLALRTHFVPELLSHEQKGELLAIDRQIRICGHDAAAVLDSGIDLPTIGSGPGCSGKGVFALRLARQGLTEGGSRGRAII
jgi:hypothetical protein